MMKTARPEKNKEDEDEDTSPDSVYPNPPCCCGKESPIECGVYCKKHTTREWCEPVCERNPRMPCIQFKRKKRAKEKAEEKLISDRVARETRDAGEMSPASLRRFNEMHRDVDRFDENWTSSLVLPWFDATASPQVGPNRHDPAMGIDCFPATGAPYGIWKPLHWP
jgi:hypothetical protein